MIHHVVSVSGGKDSAATWRAVRRFEGVYEVSSGGDIRRVGGAILRPYMRPGKYAAAVLSKFGITTTVLVHRVVAEAFCTKPDRAKEVNHLNVNKHDNRAENLERCTRSENNLQPFRVLGRTPVFSCKGRFGAKHPLSKKVIGTNKETGEVRTYESTQMAAKDGFTQSAVAQRAREVGGIHKGWVWRYAD